MAMHLLRRLAGTRLGCAAPRTPFIASSLPQAIGSGSLPFSTSSSNSSVHSLYVANLPYSWKKEEVKNLFESCGPIVRVRLHNDKKTKRFLGYGFVDFESEAGLEKAFELDLSNVDGRNVIVGRGNKAAPPSPRKEKTKEQRIPKPNSFTTVYVGHLPKDMTETAVQELFAECGDIRKVELIRDPAGFSRGYGSIEFENPAAAVEAFKLAGRSLGNDGHGLLVKIPKEGHSSTSVKVLNVHRMTTGEDLKTYFASYGTVTHVHVVTDCETGKPKGVAYVTFDEADAVDKAILARSIDIRGRQAVITFAKPRDDTANTLFVGNLPEDVTEAQVDELFGKFGPIYQVRLRNDPSTSRVFAHVQFNSVAAAKAAVRAKGVELAGRKLYTHRANDE
ncbi:unnamed protein product [Aphanomyces euteiches]|uniref:RRM domain-containing protein n=1 Tax=Aphanomyces euteiches TaxID=100861 RepID=A0A6G0WVU9_9STRA|nr:hypothetical protein Ae201684_011219 [Aphanomyces euteiches]KAH9058437.1 hypothetical protein Ae201684P_005780 [Aphanomyces euteiches]KAH9145634.1 hypothetical protein AeRB84_010445 [Aphanomyces euteiches]